MAKDNFSQQSKDYAAFRPKLQQEVYDFVIQHVQAFDLAWDVGTGNGQTAVELSKVFKHVVGTDISENQLSHAVERPNIIYKKESAEHSSLENSSVDLITIAQAIHWFDFDHFYKEVKRVARPGAVIAAFSYSMFRAEDTTIDNIIQQFYIDSGPYWDPERKYIDAQYKTIPFPFAEIKAPVFYITYEWNIEQVIGYMRTWSANQHYRKNHGVDLVSDDFKNFLQQNWPGEEKVSLNFPVYMRIGKVAE
jgi:ubiquinone/menaquinone biosynthesis C-methylase UbiE